ncbi:phosphoglycerate kinase [Candidatus Dependentiae bacterium]|nr:phosphoglycerate kinase [Candidatus Dependentiae bacterium]
MEKINYSKLKDIDIKNKRVFLRADLNVPLKNKKILQDYKLEKILPTIDYILKNNGKIILATHIGRPDAKGHTNFFDESLTTKILVPWFKKKGYRIRYEIDLEKAKILSKENFDEILLLENLRFFNGEKGNIQEKEKFANILKEAADIYVNDSFALAHRDDTSVTLLSKKFKIKAIGLLVQKEISELNKIKNNPEQPFLVILGGNKLKTKLPLIKNLILKENNKPSCIIIGGAIAKDMKNENDLLKKAKENNINILLPIDNCKNDIGSKTIELFIQEINKAKTIFINGTMGIYEKEESQKGTKEILNAIANSSVYSVAGGGDCVAAIYMFGLEKEFDFLSTGGGATLAYLAGKKINVL